MATIITAGGGSIPSDSASGNLISTANSTASLLTGGATFTGVWEEVVDYTTVAVAIIGDNLTTGTLYIEASQDGGIVVNSVPYTIADTTFDLPHVWNIVESHIRIRYVNDGVAQTGFFQLQTKYSNGQELGLLQNAGDTITANTDVQNVRAVSTGVLPDGSYVNEKLGGTIFATSATLLAAASFDSTLKSLIGYTQVQTSVDSDVDGTINLEFYSDSAGTVLVRTLSIPYLSSSGFQLYAAPAFTDYVKYKYTNGSTNQTTFHYETKATTSSINAQLLNVTSPIAGGMISSVVRTANEFDLDAVRRHNLTTEALFFFGENNNLANGTWAGVTTSEVDFHWATAAAKIKVKSTHAADTSAGLGLQSVEIHGLDSTGAEIEEVLSLSGTTPVESVNSYLRVTLCHSEAVGTYHGSHQGDIEIRVTNATFANGALLGIMKGIDGAVDSDVYYGFGESQLGFTSIPLGKVGYITRIEVIPNSAKPIDVALYESEDILDVTTPFTPRRVLWSAKELSAPVEKVFKSHVKIKALADIFFNAEGNGQASGVAVWCDYYLVDEDSNGR